jgi:pyruvate dehydrogenase E2 component (dihydrolipoamide acetyltransferase)
MSAVREIRLPALSATMEEATLLSWKVAPGDEVREGQAIAEVSTDKVDMDLECPFTGVIQELLVEAGDVVPLGGVLATIATEAEDLLGGLVLDGEPEPAGTSEQDALPGPELAADAGAGSSPIVPASPPARRLARELGVDLGQIEPTGVRGQVTPVDVKRFAEARTEPAAPRSLSNHEAGALVSAQSSERDDTRRLAVRRATAEIMTRTAAIPQFTLWRTLVLDRAAVGKGGRSWTTVMVRALAEALRRHPEINVRWDEATRTTVPFDTIGIGLAVDRPGIGLVVAAVADPDLVDADAADRMVRGAADRAKNGKLRPEDLAQASLTLSNLGGFSVDRFTALLFPPQATIVSVGSIRMRPIATAEGALKAALTCEVGLTVDHRVADGAEGARFFETFAILVEQG